MAVQALEELVCASCLIIKHVLLDEAHVARVEAVAVANSLLDGLLQWRL